MTDKVGKNKIKVVKKVPKRLTSVEELTDEEREAVTIVFHQFETGLREGTIFTKVNSLRLASNSLIIMKLNSLRLGSISSVLKIIDICIKMNQYKRHGWIKLHFSTSKETPISLLSLSFYSSFFLGCFNGDEISWSEPIRAGNNRHDQ
jgi:hypothetical protein